MEFENETFFTCPYCAQNISMVLEELYGRQSYVEDCEVCCQPIELSFEFRDQELVDLEVRRA